MKKSVITVRSTCCKAPVIIQASQLTEEEYRCTRCLAYCDIVTTKSTVVSKEVKKIAALTNSEFELLEKYSLFLEKYGYMDVDWRAEEPTAIDRFTEYLRKRGKKDNKKSGKGLKKKA